MGDHLNRRDFNRLTAAAFGGLMAGGMAACSDNGAAKPEGQTAGDDENLLLVEPHVCRGLNTCKGKGACKTAANDCKGKNACAGQGACASVAKHDCGGENACKGQGGCGTNAGQNGCKGKGGCSIPLMDKAWKVARPKFEQLYEKKYGKKAGPAPAKAKS